MNMQHSRNGAHPCSSIVRANIPKFSAVYELRYGSAGAGSVAGKPINLTIVLVVKSGEK
jgi:hypothetical protein